MYLEKEKQIKNYKLLLENGKEIFIPLREDGYIFATALCKVVGKQINHWLKLKETKDFVCKLKSNDNITSQLVETYKGKSSKHNQGTWIHQKLGVQLAHWCSPNLALQVSKWSQKYVEKKDNISEDIYKDFLKIKKELDNKISINKELENKDYNEENKSIIKDKEDKIIDLDSKEKRKIYREINKEKIAENDKKYKEKNKEKLKEKKKEYREQNKEKLSNLKKEWYLKNKDKVIERVKKNYEHNKEQRLVQVKEYANKNKDKIKERNMKDITCDCGAVLRKNGLKKHLETQKHADAIKKLNS